MLIETPKFSHLLTPFQFHWNEFIDAFVSIQSAHQQNDELVLFFDGQNDAPKEEGGWGFWLGIGLGGKEPSTFYIPEALYQNFGPVMPGEYSTCNTAEFHGLYYGLSWLHQMFKLGTNGINKRGKRLSIYGDSQLTVNLFAKRWKGKKPHLQVFAKRCQKLAAELPFETITATWIPREHNDRADLLSNQGRSLVVE